MPLCSEHAGKAEEARRLREVLLSQQGLLSAIYNKYRQGIGLAVALPMGGMPELTDKDEAALAAAAEAAGGG